jgi:ABC-2 type transport system permease protein
VPRSHIVSATMVAALAAIATVAAGLFAGIVVGGVVGDLNIPIAKIGAACLSLALLAAAIAAITIAAAALTGKRGVAIGTGTAVAVASYAIDAFFPLSTTLKPLAKISLWYPYSTNQPLVNGLDASNAAILVVIGIAATAVAYWAFERRDLG